MRTLILGAGATGGYFGARLVESGAAVDFLVRPARAELLKRDGLRVRTPAGDLHARVNALVALPDSYRCDLVLLSCKAYDLDSAIEAIAPAIASGAQVLPLLNGLRHLQVLDQAFGSSKVLGGLCHISVTLQGDGSIRQFGSLDRLTFGARPGQPAIPTAIRDTLLGMNAQAICSDNVVAAMWSKFTMLTALAGITCLMRASIGEIVAVSGGAELARRLYQECMEVAKRSGYEGSEESRSEAIQILTAAHSPLKASMLRDVERGHRSEVEHVLGDMLSRAQALDVDAPLLGAACTHLRIHEAALQARTVPE
ncbi:MAG TPA: ketopantoate reductase family protein [Dokdonella sp.]|uniref:ketopantoate reductase family protein n=1 Tax=Dokdonella sp. TaxID=2291710 RepID=UPI002D80205D|nr:ketopantoate reductase family protein [Dokdonella sp.]HET9031282.1 ketopantoate reductase family protein [Dokdonella sp.]